MNVKVDRWGGRNSGKKAALIAASAAEMSPADASLGKVTKDAGNQARQQRPSHRTQKRSIVPVRRQHNSGTMFDKVLNLFQNLTVKGKLPKDERILGATEELRIEVNWRDRPLGVPDAQWYRYRWRRARSF